MFVGHKRVYSRILLAADLLAALTALTTAYYLRSFVRFVPLEIYRHFNPVLLPFREYLFYFLIGLPVLGAVLWMTQRYEVVLQRPLQTQLTRIVHFTLVSGFLLGFMIFTFQVEISRPIFFGFLLGTALLMALNRFLMDAVLRSRNLNEHNQINLLVVGAGEAALRLVERLEGFRRWGFHVLGYLSLDDKEEKPADSTAEDLPVLGSLQDLGRLLQGNLVVHEIIFVGSDLADLAGLEETIRLCQQLGIRIRVAADFFPATSGVSVDFADNLPLITLSSVPEHSLALVAKRAVDFVVATGCMILLSPLMLATAFLIKLNSPGPVFYRQVRCGQYGRPFTLIKFRTMVDGAEDRLWEIRHMNEMSGPVFKMRNDPRVTWIGRFLRKSSIDELPQFWNVLKGEMSVVGPRAPLPEEVTHYSVSQRRRLSVKPGITCLWQVSGRSEIDFQQWMDLDLHYIDNWSFWLDLQIMLRTIPAVFTGRGAR